MRIGLLFDYPQPDDGEHLEVAVRLGLEAVGADAGVVFHRETALGHPHGEPGDVAAGLETLADQGADVVIGPSISDNCLAARDVADAHELPTINYSGGERTRSAWMFHYQVGSLEEEPPLLVERLRERGLGSVAVVHDASVVGRRFAEVLGWAAADAGIVITGSAAIDALANDLDGVVAWLRAGAPAALVYLGLGAASHAVALTLAAAGWDVPVLASSALMFGYARPDWRDAWAGWEYVDTVADDNPVRAALLASHPRVAAGPIGCAAYDMGRLVGLARRRAPNADRAGLRPGLEAVKQVPAASGSPGTLMGFGAWDRGALKGPFLVLRTWRDGRTVPVER